MSEAKKLYVRFLRAIAITTIVCTAYLVVMTDHQEEREPWEFVPVQSK